MGGTWGRYLRLSIFGESHGHGLGIVLDGLPPGTPIDESEISIDMARRAPGKDATATKRKEADHVTIMSGVYKDLTTGTPICGMIQNTDTRGHDYRSMKTLARPGHADYTGNIRYRGFQDVRGGGHFSGRLTAPLVFAGSLARQYLAAKSVTVGAHILSIGFAQEKRFDACSIDKVMLDSLRQKIFPVLDDISEQAMRLEVEEARMNEDSVGGVIECAVVGQPAGWGTPFFDSIESRMAQLFFSIPAVKGVEFGDGFGLSSMRGSQANDAFCMQGGRVETKTNHNGGINGGITNGMPIIIRVAIKPTPSIGQEQETIDYKTLQDKTVRITGRHDPCIVLRAVPVVEAAVLLALADAALEVECS